MSRAGIRGDAQGEGQQVQRPEMGQNYVSEMELDGYQGPDQDFRFKKKKKDFRFYSE